MGGSSNSEATSYSATVSVSEDDATTENDLDIEVESRDAAAVDSSPPPPFSVGEKVLALYSQFPYDAKVERVDFWLKEWKFCVHYMGFRKKYDEWLGVERLMKYTEENVKKQQELLEASKNAKSVRAEQFKPKPVARGKKRKNDSNFKDSGISPLEKLVNIQIPSTLKKQLIDDGEFITHLGKLVKLPRTPNVDEVFNQYLDYRLKKDITLCDSVGEVLSGLRCYFDKALPAMLLYKSERQQYQEAIADDISPSTVYGAEHLLRLFVKLPELLYHAKIEEETLTELQQKLMDFLRFLQKNQSAFFLSSY